MNEVRDKQKKYDCEGGRIITHQKKICNRRKKSKTNKEKDRNKRLPLLHYVKPVCKPPNCAKCRRKGK